MNRTNIEWVKNPDGTQGYTLNPITGCLNHTNGLCNGGGFPCYAYKLANRRLRKRYLANENIAPIGTMIEGAAMRERALADPFYPRFWESRLIVPLKIAKPCGIFVVDMGELFGDWIPLLWQKKIFEVIHRCPQHRFYLLTKCPENLIKFSPFPNHCYVGVTATNQQQFVNAVKYLKEVKATVKFINFEPLLERINIG